MIKRIVVFLYLFTAFYSLSAQHTLSQLDQDHYYRLGLDLIQKKQYGAAREALETYLQLPGEKLHKTDAQYFRAYSALRLYHSDGEKLLREFVNQNEDHPKALIAYYELGNFYFKEKNYRRAIRFYEEADLSSLNNAQRAEAQFKLAYSYFGFKEFDKARPLFNKVKSGTNPHTHAASYYAGYIAYTLGDYDQALADLEKAGEHASYETVIPHLVATIYNRQERYDELIAYGENVIKNDQVKNREQIMGLIGDAYFKKGDFKNAERYLSQFVDANRSNAPQQALYKLGYSQYQNGSYAPAIENLKQVALAPDTLGQYASYYLGALYVKENNKVFASMAFERAMSANYNNEISQEAAFNYGKVNYDQGKYAEAIAALRDFAAQWPDHERAGEANDLIGEAYLRTTNYDLALEHIESLGVKSEKIKRIYQKVAFYKGVELFNNSRYYDAVQLFQKSLKNDFDKEIVAQTYFWMGEAYSIGEKYDEAINAYGGVFRNAQENDQVFLKARYGIGYAYYNSKRYDRALPHFREYVSRLENARTKLYYNDALIRLGDCYYATKDYRNAIRIFDKAIAANVPESDYAHYQKGVALGVIDNLSDAKASLQTLLNKFPNSRYRDDAMFEIAQLDLENGNYEQAVEGFSTLINQSRRSRFAPYAYLRRALAYFNLKQYNRSIADYKTILNNYITHETANSALLGLQEALTLEGTPGEIEDYLARYKAANPDNTNLKNIEFESAKSLYFNQQYDRAVTAFTEYLRSYPDSEFSGEAKYFLADSYLRKGEPREALTFFHEVAEDPTLVYSNRSVSRIAEIEFELGNYNTAIAYNKKLLKVAESKKEQYYAWAGLMESYYHTGEYDSVAYYAQIILEKGIVSAAAQNHARLYLGKAAFARENYEEAVDHFVNALNTAKDIYGAEAQYLMAEVFYRKGQYNQSIQTLYDLNEKFGAYEEWLGKSFLLIADNYIALDENFQAKATLNSLIEKSPVESVRKEAAKKLEELEKATQTPVEQDTSIFQNEPEAMN